MYILTENKESDGNIYSLVHIIRTLFEFLCANVSCFYSLSYLWLSQCIPSYEVKRNKKNIIHKRSILLIKFWKFWNSKLPLKFTNRFLCLFVSSELLLNKLWNLFITKTFYSLVIKSISIDNASAIAKNVKLMKTLN